VARGVRAEADGRPCGLPVWDDLPDRLGCGRPCTRPGPRARDTDHHGASGCDDNNDEHDTDHYDHFDEDHY
jgi:hypothetical protein